MTDKKSARLAWSGIQAKNATMPQWGKAAEKLRSLQVYRQASVVFAAPGQSLLQARINCLADGKTLVMPAPAIRDGFFILPGRSIPFKNFSAAVTYKGIKKNGHLLKLESIPKLSLGLMLTEALAVDFTGGRLGDGNGFFDLCCALLHELGGLQQDLAVIAFIPEEQLSRDPLPQDAWDIKMTGAITPRRIIQFNQARQKPQIFWNVLPLQRIKRIDPLWKLFKVKNQGKGCKVHGNKLKGRGSKK